MKRFVLLLLAVLPALLYGSPSAVTADSTLWQGVRQMAVQLQQGNLDAARGQADLLLPVADSLHDKAALVSLYAMRGMSTEARKPDEALQDYSRGIALCEQGTWLRATVEAGHEEWLRLCISMYIQTAILHKAGGRRREAIKAARRGAGWAMASSDASVRATSILAVSDLLTESDDRQQTEKLLAQAYYDAKATGRKDQLLMAATHLLAIGVNRQMFKEDLSKDSILASAGIRTTATAKSDTATTATADSLKKTATHRHSPQTTTGQPAAKANRPLAAGQPQPTARIWTAGAAILLALLFLFFLYWQRRRQRQQAMKSYLEGKEEERKRLARELHDGVGNQLLAIQMKLNSDGATEQALQLLSESREQVRRVSHGLMPPEFSNTTLAEAVAAYADAMDGNGECAVSCTVSPADADWSWITDKQALEVYRIVQEAVANALRHADATTVAVGLQMQGTCLTATVSDNGTAATAAVHTGIGLQTMQQRADSIGATLLLRQGRYGHVVRLTLQA